jgi:Protein of unknown function (DUF2786)
MHADEPISRQNSVERLLELATSMRALAFSTYTYEIVDRLCTLDASAVNRATSRSVIEKISTAWNVGWQPRELFRQVRRTSDAPTVGLALFAIATDHANRPASSLDARWIAQLDDMNLPAAAAGDDWLAEWGRVEQVPRHDQVGAVVSLLQALSGVPPIEVLIPPPGASAGDARVINLTTKTDDPILNRVRALLAQAESTNFEAEAETFTAKAQELMTRHAIDMAMVAAGSHRSERPGTIRLPLDEPYVSAKWILLNVVAANSRCRAILHKRIAMATVIGFEADLTATETLFTSLLVQARVAMQVVATSAPPGTRARSRGFRSSFLMAYAYRVGERLEEINAHVVAEAEAETGLSIFPVLAARSLIVDTAVKQIFPRLGKASSRAGQDPEGWVSGRMAADRAKLNSGDLPNPIRALPEARRATR